MFTRKWNSIGEEIDHVLDNRGENHTRQSRHEWIRWVILSFLSLSEIIELYLFYPELTSMEINNATARQFLFLGHALFYLLNYQRTKWFASQVAFGILLSCFFKLLFLDILYYSNFFQLFFIRNFTLLFTFVFFHNYTTLIYMSTLADFPFRQCRVR